MRNMLALIGLAVVGFGGAGWYFGWYKLSFTRGADGTLQVTTNVNTDQLLKDASEGARHVGEFIGNRLSNAPAGAPTTAATTPAPAVPAQTEVGAWLFGVEPAPPKQ